VSAPTRLAAPAALLRAAAALLAFGLGWGCGTAEEDGSQRAAGAAASELAVVRLTGIPDENPTALIRRNRPLIAYLSEQLGAPVEYIPVTDYGAAVEALRSGKVDFAWLGGFTFVQARRLAGAVPLVMREVDRSFRSVLIAGAATGITGPADLRGRTFAFGSKSSTSGHLMPRHLLSSLFGIDPDTDFAGRPIYTGAHDATARAVESGKVAAGALNALVWTRLVETGQVDADRVRVIWETPTYVDYVWAARPSVPTERLESFRKAFLELDGSRTADQTVLAVQDARRFVRAEPHDFDAIEAVALSTGLLRE